MANTEEYMPQLRAEKESIDSSFIHAARLLAEEIDRLQTGGDKVQYTEVHHDKPVKIKEKVMIPIKEFPKVNFVGKLLGPGGSSLKRLQSETGTKMSILGRGSMRNKQKEEELRKEGGKYAHLTEDLHMLVEVFAPPDDAHARLGHALTELKKYLTPEMNEEIQNEQMGGGGGGRMMQLNGREQMTAAPTGMRGRGRGRGRGVPTQRGRGAALLASPPARGAPVPRGAASRPGRGMAPRPLVRQEQSYSTYGGEEEFYGNTGYEETGGYGDGTYEAYGSSEGYDYGHGAETAATGYEDYGQSWGMQESTYGKTPARGRGTEQRAAPYRGGRFQRY